MRPLTLVREAWRSARAALVPTVLVALVCAVVGLLVVGTAGRSVAGASAMSNSLTQVSARKLSVVDTGGQGFISGAAAASISSLSTVSRVVGLSIPVDAWNGGVGSGGNHVPLWQANAVASIGRLEAGRWPRRGEAVVTPTSMKALGLAAPTGYVVTTSGEQFPIVGLIQPTAPYDDLSEGIVAALDQGTTLREVRLVVDSVGNAQLTQDAVLRALAPPDPSQVQVDSPVRAAQQAQQLIGQFASYGRTLVLLSLVGGGLLVTLVVLADVLIRRRDLGRRRTLGITRGDLVLLVALRTSISAVVGSVVGCGAATVLIAATSHVAVPLAFVGGTAVMTVLVSALGALLPAWLAATRDPVAVMRTP